jgi:hypothetical protein
MMTMTLRLVFLSTLSLVSPLYGFAPVRSPKGQTLSGLHQAIETTDSEMSTTMSTTSEELIPREVLFGNPKYANPQLSPDGKYLSFLAPSPENVLNVFVKLTTEPLENARMITNDKSRGIRSVMWAQDSKTALYMQDFEVG